MPRLFALIYFAGNVTTTFLSNDAIAVVLALTVYAAARTAKAEPLPLLLAWAGWSAPVTGACERFVEREPLSAGGKAALAGIVGTAVLLAAVSALDAQLSYPPCLPDRRRCSASAP